MSIYYDLYENPDKEGTEEQKLLHARVVPSGTYTTKEFVERVSMMHHIPHAQLVGAVEAIQPTSCRRCCPEDILWSLEIRGIFT